MAKCERDIGAALDDYNKTRAEQLDLSERLAVAISEHKHNYWPDYRDAVEQIAALKAQIATQAESVRELEEFKDAARTTIGRIADVLYQYGAKDEAYALRKALEGRK